MGQAQRLRRPEPARTRARIPAALSQMVAETENDGRQTTACELQKLGNSRQMRCLYRFLPIESFTCLEVSMPGCAYPVYRNTIRLN